MILAFSLLFTCHTVWSQFRETFAVQWNLTNKYGLPSFWLNADSKISFAITILVPNSTGTIEFGAYVREESGMLIRKVPAPVNFYANHNHHVPPHTEGPFTVEELMRANPENYMITVTITLPGRRSSYTQIEFLYALCLDEEEKCQGYPASACIENSFCFRNTHLCMSFYDPEARSSCEIHEKLEPHRVCDARGTAHKSLCHVYQSPYRAQTFHSILMDGTFDCKRIQVFFRERKSNKVIFPGSYHNRSEPLNVSCSGTDRIQLGSIRVRVEERLEGGNVSFHRNFRCDSLIHLGNPKSMFSVTYLRVVYLDAGTMSYIHLVNMMFNRSNINVKLCKQVLACALNASVTGPFKTRFLLFKYNERHSAAADTSRVRYSNETEQTWTLTEIDHYVCRVEVRFRGCAPFTTFEHYADKIVKMDSLDGKCTDMIDIINIPVDEESSDGQTNILIIVASCVSLALITALSIWYCICRKKICKKTKTGRGKKKVAAKKTVSSKWWPFDRRKTTKLVKDKGHSRKNKGAMIMSSCTVHGKKSTASFGKGDSKKTTASFGKGDSKKSTALLSGATTVKTKMSSSRKTATAAVESKTSKRPKKKDKKRESHEKHLLLPKKKTTSPKTSLPSYGSSKKAEKTGKTSTQRVTKI